MLTRIISIIALVAALLLIPQPATAATDLPGWKLVLDEDFNDPAAEGTFLDTYGSRWGAYPEDYLTTEGQDGSGDHYSADILSVSGGILNMALRRGSDDKAWGAAPHYLDSQLYGRYAVRFKADPVPGWKTAWLLWPDSEQWPQDGEIDFPEGSLDGTISAFMHRQGGSDGSDQDAYDTDVGYSDWHTAEIEWKPDSLSFILDGKTIGTSTDRVPNTPMKWVLQTENNIGGEQPGDPGKANVSVDWAAVWSYAP